METMQKSTFVLCSLCPMPSLFDLKTWNVHDHMVNLHKIWKPSGCSKNTHSSELYISICGEIPHIS